MKGKASMKRILLTLAAAGALLVGSAALLAGGAGAANPHGDKSDPNAGCNSQGQGNPGGNCSDPGLPQSQGCQNGQAPVQNPHCQTTVSGITPAPSTPPTSSPANNPGQQAGQGQAGKNAQGVAGQEQAGGQAGNAGTAAVSNGQQIEQLPFTGLEDLWLALVGAGMLALGLVLRVRTSPSPEEAVVPADDPPVSRGESTGPNMPDLGTGLSMPDLGMPTVESLWSLVIRAGHARLRAGPAQARLRAGPGGARVAVHARMRAGPAGGLATAFSAA